MPYRGLRRGEERGRGPLAPRITRCRQHWPAFFGLLTDLLDPPLGVSVGIGALAFAALVAGHMRMQGAMYRAAGGEETVRFPSSPELPNVGPDEQHR